MIETREEIHPIFNNCPNNLEFRKLRKRIIRQTRDIIHNFETVKTSFPKFLTTMKKIGAKYEIQKN